MSQFHNANDNEVQDTKDITYLLELFGDGKWDVIDTGEEKLVMCGDIIVCKVDLINQLMPNSPISHNDDTWKSQKRRAEIVERQMAWILSAAVLFFQASVLRESTVIFGVEYNADQIKLRIEIMDKVFRSALRLSRGLAMEEEIKT